MLKYSYQAEKRWIEAELVREAVTEDFIKNLEGFVATIRKGMKKADNDFDVRRQIIEILGATVELTVGNGEPVFYPRSVFKAVDAPISYSASRQHELRFLLDDSQRGAKDRNRPRSMHRMGYNRD